MDALLVSPDRSTREAMKVAVSALQRRGFGPIGFLEVEDGLEAIEVAWRTLPKIVVADEITSHAGAFALVRDLRGQQQAYPGVIVIWLERAYDTWLAKWSGADAWFVKPADPFVMADRLAELMKESA